MIEDPPIVKTGDEARQGVRVKGMTTVLAVSLAAAIVLISIIAMMSANK
ncbi:hypothetical protein [Aquidulcibacter sp.]|jgi:hypothetical protein|nr:hypothetical protein [Aquidulcibacter sp.]MCE2891996.1 hypothetical protein [Hyphomonadaceae bacterium]MCZ8207545.1 hypothetical protein [Aquidulcibacter sp.]